MAKIFFDLPSNDSGDQANDPYLAGQIYFAIDPAGAVTDAGERRQTRAREQGATYDADT